MDTDLESFIERPTSEAELRAELRTSRWYYVALTALVSLLVGVAVGRFGQNPTTSISAQAQPTIHWEQSCAPPVSTASAAVKEPTVTPAPLNIYVSGAVAEPQVITVPAGSLVADALEVIGGAAPHADMDAVNLAAPLADHQQILIPGKTEVCPTTAGKAETVVEPAQGTVEIIDLNTAAEEELQTLTGIGASRARDIVAYRETNGPFQHIEEIQYVSGIGEGIFAQIEPYITVGSGQD